eukprot:5982549-Amphidinium_carterae.1
MSCPGPRETTIHHILLDAFQTWVCFIIAGWVQQVGRTELESSDSLSLNKVASILDLIAVVELTCVQEGRSCKQKAFHIQSAALIEPKQMQQLQGSLTATPCCLHEGGPVEGGDSCKAQTDGLRELEGSEQVSTASTLMGVDR